MAKQKLKDLFPDTLKDIYSRRRRYSRLCPKWRKRPVRETIMGIIDEGKEVMGEYKGMPALDAGLLVAAQAVEHYGITRYGTLRTWAAELSYKDEVKCSMRR
jgi:ferritin-like metal-binding protein YciE